MKGNMGDKVFEFTGTITCRVILIEEYPGATGWQRHWCVSFDDGIVGRFTGPAEETAKKAVSAKYNIPIEELSAQRWHSVLVNVSFDKLG